MQLFFQISVQCVVHNKAQAKRVKSNLILNSEAHTRDRYENRDMRATLTEWEEVA